MGLVIAVSYVVGLIVYRFVRYNPLRLNLGTLYEDHSENNQHDIWMGKLTAFFIHILNEFFEMSKYLAIGALITATIHTFVNTFSIGSLITFLVLGPMLDLKGTLMLLLVFKTKYVATLAVVIPVTVLVFSIVLDQWLLR